MVFLFVLSGFDLGNADLGIVPSFSTLWKGSGRIGVTFSLNVW